MSQTSIAIAALVIAGLWYADRYMARLRKGKRATLVTGRAYAALLFIGLILALIWG